MKALILSAGTGTRLLPYTRVRPKPLFSLAQRPLIDRLIHDLYRAGAEAVVLNVHHLSEMIENHVQNTPFPIPVRLSYEPVILGTGGAIAKHAATLGEAPFFVINGDILTDIDFRAVYAWHLSHGDPATLVLVADPEFNTVVMGPDKTIRAFGTVAPAANAGDSPGLTFTGIQVLDKTILDYIPHTGFSTSIDAYRRMLADGRRIRAWVPRQAYWKDIGTPERYQDAALDALAAEAFSMAWPALPATLEPTFKAALAGDGSDRTWFRIFRKEKRLVAVHHGIQTERRPREMESWVSIGRFLKSRGLPVPTLYACDRFSGWAVMEDLGDVSLQDYVRRTPSPKARIRVYEQAIRHLIDFSINGVHGFDLTWAYQGPAYDEHLILDRECRYFIDAFVNHYLGFDIPFGAIEKECERLARRAIGHAWWGLMHRDFQSRNIMVTGDRVFFIDFQGARIGPIQYDLAALLLDPYVDLPVPLQETLFAFAEKHLAGRRTLALQGFKEGYHFCAVCRNLQVLGAFAHLSRVKGKQAFEAYIPAAVRTLGRLVEGLSPADFPRLRALTARIATAVGF